MRGMWGSGVMQCKVCTAGHAMQDDTGMQQSSGCSAGQPAWIEQGSGRSMCGAGEDVRDLQGVQGKRPPRYPAPRTSSSCILPYSQGCHCERGNQATVCTPPPITGTRTGGLLNYFADSERWRVKKEEGIRGG